MRLHAGRLILVNCRFSVIYIGLIIAYRRNSELNHLADAFWFAGSVRNCTLSEAQ